MPDHCHASKIIQESSIRLWASVSQRLPVQRSRKFCDHLNKHGKHHIGLMRYMRLARKQRKLTRQAATCQGLASYSWEHQSPIGGRLVSFGGLELNCASPRMTLR